MERDQAKKIIEALLYMTDHGLTPQEIAEVLEQKSMPEAEVRSMVAEIATELESKGSPLKVVEVAGGIQMATQPEFAPWIRKLYKERLTVRLSTSALETLAIIAYKQPISRSDIEQIRGVEVGGVMETLLERRLVKVVGRKETIGRPLLYGTTPEFLKHFGLRHLTELPDITAVQPATPASEVTAVEEGAQPELIPVAPDGSAIDAPAASTDVETPAAPAAEDGEPRA